MRWPRVHSSDLFSFHMHLLGQHPKTHGLNTVYDLMTPCFIQEKSNFYPELRHLHWDVLIDKLNFTYCPVPNFQALSKLSTFILVPISVNSHLVLFGLQPKALKSFSRLNPPENILSTWQSIPTLTTSHHLFHSPIVLLHFFQWPPDWRHCFCPVPLQDRCCCLFWNINQIVLQL